MGWFASSLNPAGGLKHVSWDIAVFSNFYSLMAQESGAPRPTGVWCMDTLNVGSTLTAQAFNAPTFSANSLAAGAFKEGGVSIKQLLQRIYFKDTTSRGSLSQVFSTYTIASITPLSSLSTLLVRAGIYYGLASPSGLEVQFASHLMRNPTVVGSFAYLTNSAAPLTSANVGQPMGGVVAGGTGVAVLGEISGLMAFEAVDSVTTLDPRQYGVDWSTFSGTACIAGGYLTVEEWL